MLTFQKTDNGWRELLIDLDGQGKLYYRITAEPTTSSNSLIRPPLDSGDRTELEISARGLGLARQLATRVDKYGGIALIADYGHEGEKGDTFRVCNTGCLSYLRVYSIPILLTYFIRCAITSIEFSRRDCISERVQRFTSWNWISFKITCVNCTGKIHRVYMPLKIGFYVISLLW